MWEFSSWYSPDSIYFVHLWNDSYSSLLVGMQSHALYANKECMPLTVFFFLGPLLLSILDTLRILCKLILVFYTSSKYTLSDE